MKKKLLFLTTALLSFCSLESWASEYGAYVYVESGNSAMGLVYTSTEEGNYNDDYYKDTDNSDWGADEEKLGTDVTMYIYAKPNDGYQFVGWEPIRNVKSIGDATQPNTSVAAEVYDNSVDNKDAYLVANFAPFKYNFYFYKDLEATADKVENVEYGKSVNLPQYTTEGKTLLGWRNKENGHYYKPTATMKADMVNEEEIHLLALWDKPAEVTLNESGLATYSSAVDVVIATSGVKAYCADVDEENDETIILSETKGRIPAGTGIILYGEPGTTVEFNYATEAVKAASIVNNYLRPTTLANGKLAICQELGDEDEWHYYALGPNAEFLKYTGNSFVHNRAYFVIVDNKTAAKALKIVFDDATAITPVATEKQQTGTRKFIENGKLVIEKNGVKYNAAGIRE